MTSDPALRPPIFVLGAPFSGANLLAWSMAQHPNIEHAINTAWLNDLSISLAASYETDSSAFESSMLQVRGVSRAAFFAKFGEAVNQLFLPELISAPQPRRWIDSTPQHTYAVAGLRELFPEARFVLVLRDIDSILDVASEPLRDLRHEGDQEAICREWLSTMRALLEAEKELGNNRPRRVHYRDLMADPEATLRSCFAYVDETFTPDSLRFFSTLTPSVAGTGIAKTKSGICSEAADLSASLGL